MGTKQPAKTILVVDDEELMRDLLADEIRNRGFNVVTAPDGLTGSRTASEQNVDLILSDVRMPGGSGLELLDLIRKKNPMTPVVLLITAFADITLEEALDRGAEMLLAKPFDLDELFAVIDRALKAKEQRWSCPVNGSLKADLTIDLKFPSMDSARKAGLLNLGRGGMFLAKNGKTVQPPKNVRFRIGMGEEFTISGIGVLLWSRPFKSADFTAGCGIEFIQLDDECRERVVELIDFIKPKAFIPRR